VVVIVVIVVVIVIVAVIIIIVVVVIVAITIIIIVVVVIIIIVVVVYSILVTKLRHTAADWLHAYRQLHCHWRTCFSSSASLTSVVTVIQRIAESRFEEGQSSVQRLAFGRVRVAVPNRVTCVGLSFCPSERQRQPCVTSLQTCNALLIAV